MDYKEKYEAALNRAKAAIDIAADKDLVKGVATTIFPELRESEDERIRKHLIKHFSNKSKEEWNGMPIKDILAWLEKQKINTEGDFGRGYDCGYQAGYAVAVNEMKPKVATATLATVTLDSEKQKEQKPVEWSEEDEKILNELITIMDGGKVTSGTYLSEYVSWLKSLRPSWKPSEEQICSLGTVVKGIGESSFGVSKNLRDLYEQLKKMI